MTPVAATSEAPVQIDEATAPSVCEQDSDADLLQGLGVLADLIGDASKTLNQCLLTIEEKLGASLFAREEWIPIPTARSGVDRFLPADEMQPSQERMFGGVPVTIMRFAAPAPQPVRTQRCEWQYELGYSTTGDDEPALMIRTVSFDHTDDSSRVSDLMPLREAPLEIRLKAIREVPTLIQLLDSLGAEGLERPAAEGLEDEPQVPAVAAPEIAAGEDVVEQAAS